MKKSEDYRYWLYEYKYNTFSNFLDYVSYLIGNRNIRINVLLIKTQGDLKEELERWMPANFDVKLKEGGELLTLYITKDPENEEKKKTVKARIVRYSKLPSIYLIISECRTSEFKEIITKVLNKHYPKISRMFLSNSEMKVIFDKMKDKTKLDLIIEFAVGKKRIPNKKKKESEVKYTDAPYGDVFDKILVQDQWLEGVRFRGEKVIKEDINLKETEFIGTMSRSCFFSSKIDITPLVNIIIPETIQLTSSRSKRLEISSESAKNIQPEPVVIRFDKSIFSEISKNRQYINAIAELESCSISEYHTNPYIHIGMLDYLDGSSYDIWVLESDRMAIIPQVSASSASLSRIVNHIFERIHEGHVEKYEKIEITAES